MCSGLLFVNLLLWYHQESNRGHKDFQSFALPTELWHHCFCGCKGKKYYLIIETFLEKMLLINVC